MIVERACGSRNLLLQNFLASGHRLTQTGLYSVCNMVVVFVTNIVTVVISAARCAKQLGIGDVT